MDASTEKTLKQLEEMTEGMLRTLEQVDNIAQDFSRGDGGQQQLFSKVESLASSFEELHELPIAPELTVPFAVLEHIDKAENPDLYWKQVVDTTVEVSVLPPPPLRPRAPRQRACSAPGSRRVPRPIVDTRRVCATTRDGPRPCRSSGTRSARSWRAARPLRGRLAAAAAAAAAAARTQPHERPRGWPAEELARPEAEAEGEKGSVSTRVTCTRNIPRIALFYYGRNSVAVLNYV
jgi:hypothetical protein